MRGGGVDKEGGGADEGGEGVDKGRGSVLADDEAGGDEVDADAGDAGYFDNDASVALDALDDALDAGEGAGGNDNGVAGMALEVGGGEECALVVGCLGDAYEVVHLLVGYGDNLAEAVGSCCDGACHVAQGLGLDACVLEVVEGDLCGADEEQVADGRYASVAYSAALAPRAFDGGEEGAYGEGVEEVLDEVLAAVGDAHGEPVFGFGVKHSGGSPHR